MDRRDLIDSSEGALVLHDLFDPDHPLGALTLGVLMLIAAILAAKLLGIWGRRLGGQSQPLIDPTVISFLGRLLQVICFVVAAIIYAHLVPELRRLGETMLASAGVVSLVIGLAAQNTLGNLIAGFALLMYRPFAIGDVLTLSTPTGKETGTVKEFTLGYTKLMTEDGRWIIVPNSIIASNVIVRVK
jgi:small-conductance mechanosensitive channel